MTVCSTSPSSLYDLAPMVNYRESKIVGAFKPMTDELTLQAVRNNAEWCDAVCRANGVPGEMFDDLWVNWHRTPTFYPNAVTLTENGSGTQIECIRELSKSGNTADIGIKDSFCSLDLAPLGFVIWFNAEWIYRQSSLAAPDDHLGGVAWRKIESASDLMDWEAAWNINNDEPVHIFKPSLLTDKNIAFFAAYHNQRIVAGGIANKTGDVVGISNIFTPKGAAQDFWSNFTRVVMEAFPGFALVGYERDAELEIAHNLGFQSIGALRVWGKHIE